MPHAPKRLPRPAPIRPRGKTTSRGYGHAHQVQRERLLAERPLCERCGEDWSVHLHHRDRNTFNRDDANAEMLCEACHQREHGGR